MDKLDIKIIEVPLPFKVFSKTIDGRWTLKAAFATIRLAGAYVLGVLSVPGNKARIFEDRKGKLWEVTQEAMVAAEAALKEARGRLNSNESKRD